MQLVLDRWAREQGSSRGHLVENATDAPHVDGGRVLGRAQQDVGRPVPEGDHFVRVGLRGNGFGAREAEIRQLIKKYIFYV